MGGGGGKGGKKGGGSTYYKYFMSLQAGICVGPVDELKSIILGDRAIWEGTITQSTFINVDIPDAFGGAVREGGVGGGITVMMGEDHQKMPLALREKFGANSTLIPSYRGMTSLFFHEPVQPYLVGRPLADADDMTTEQIFQGAAPNPLTGLAMLGIFGGILAGGFLPGSPTAVAARKGFYWQANNPYLRDLKVVATRRAKGLDRRYSTIWRDAAETIADTNFAHIIYELQTNRDFGAGLTISKIDVESYELAAKTLYDERFGGSIKWMRQGKVKDMILEMLDHINAVCYENPRTGLSTLKLLRNDYDVADLRLATPKNSHVIDFQRKSEELVNEIVATYTDGVTYEEASVTVQDLSGIAAEGSVVSTGRNYYAVLRADLAKQLAERDLRAEGYPIATAEVEFFREFWDLNPGEVIKINSPEDSDVTLVMRVMQIDDDPAGTGPIKARLVEDIFGLDLPPFVEVPDSLFEDPDGPPQPADFIQPFTMPFTLANLAGLGPFNEADYPVAYLGVLAATDQFGVNGFKLSGNKTDPLGVETFGDFGTETIAARGTLAADLAFEALTDMPFPAAMTYGETATAGDVLLIGSGAEEGLELVGVTAVTGTVLSVRRGILDTIPREWAAGTPVWVVDLGASTLWDPTRRAAFEEVNFKVRPVNAAGILPAGSAAWQSFTLSERPYQPFRPADVTVGGIDHGQLDLLADGPVVVTWKNRGRPYEDSNFLPWNAASVPVEPGQTTTIEIINDAFGAVVTTHAGLTGETFTVPAISFTGLTTARVRVLSERDGFRSFQAQEITVTLPGGYGMNYGAAYGL
jgi:hypothetical protein